MKYDLYIYVHCDCDQPKILFLAMPLIGAVIMAKLYIDCSETYQRATYGHNEEHIFFENCEYDISKPDDELNYNSFVMKRPHINESIWFSI
jgi:hypothetical protein